VVGARTKLQARLLTSLFQFVSRSLQQLKTSSDRKRGDFQVRQRAICLTPGVQLSRQKNKDIFMKPQANISSEFVFQKKDVPFPSCHASTIVETSDGFIAAWFGGTHEKHPDVGIWLSRNLDGEWTKPVEVANGIQNKSQRYPTWNPVLFSDDQKTVLFYKVGPAPSDWWGELISSTDNGATWSNPSRLPENILGPIKNKPVLLGTGELLCPSSTEDDGWRVHVEITPDMGLTWERTEVLNGGDSVSAIQPTILVHPKGKLQILCRTRNSRIYSSWSTDNGRTWTGLEPTELPNPNSGIDAVTMKDGRHLLVYNHIPGAVDHSKRNVLNVAISNDGENWEAAFVLENHSDIDNDGTLVLDDVGPIHTHSEYSYPAVIQGSDGNIHITYTWKRESIKYVIVDPTKLQTRAIIDGNWPE
jgi:predicted neuraminidase